MREYNTKEIVTIGDFRLMLEQVLSGMFKHVMVKTKDNHPYVCVEVLFSHSRIVTEFSFDMILTYMGSNIQYKLFRIISDELLMGVKKEMIQGMWNKTI